MVQFRKIGPHGGFQSNQARKQYRKWYLAGCIEPNKKVRSHSELTVSVFLPGRKENGSSLIPPPAVNARSG